MSMDYLLVMGIVPMDYLLDFAVILPYSKESIQPGGNRT
jgi:hypothetical protein